MVSICCCFHFYLFCGFDWLEWSFTNVVNSLMINELVFHLIFIIIEN